MNNSNHYISLEKQIKDQLENGRRITSMSVLNSLGTTEIRYYIARLRKQGMTIVDKWIKKENKRFKEYWLEEPQQKVKMKWK